MGSWVFLSLLALLSPGFQGASLPYHDGYDWHFNQMGVHLDLALKDQTNPLVGGKAHVELPISAIWKIIEGENQLMKTLVIALEKTTVGKLYDIKTVKADITYDAEKVLEGIYNIAIDYTLIHRDGTEEKATVVLQGKKESGMIVNSLEVITKNLEDTSRQIIHPIKITLACSWPNAHSITINGSFGKILINIANDFNEISARVVWEYLGHQYKYSSVLSIKEKFFTLTCQDPTEQPKTLVMKPKFVNSWPTIEITGQVPTTRWFKAGEINTQLIANELFDYEFKHTNGRMDLTLKYFTMKTQIIIEYTKTMIKVLLPGTYSNNKVLEIELKYQPTNDKNLLAGGNIKMMASQDSMPIIKIGGSCELTFNAAKYEVLFNDFYVNIYDGPFKASFSHIKLFGKILIDPVNKNGLLPKISVEGKMEKDQKEVASVLLTTMETSCKLRIFYPYLLKNILNIQNHEYLEIMHSHDINGKEITITTICNLTSKKLVAKITPTMITYELLDGEVCLIKLLTNMELGTNSYLVKGKTNIILNEYSFIYKILSYVSPSLCFKDITSNYHIEVVDKATWKVDLKVHMTKDTQEILNIEVSNVQVPTITTICNFSSKKIIAKITPTMMTYELLDGEVSLLKFLQQLTNVEAGINTYLVKGKTNLNLNENSYLYKVLSYVSTSICFKDITSIYHMEVVDKAAWKVDIQVHVTKDRHELLNVQANNVQVPRITSICNFMSKKFITKITPTMMAFEVLHGEVSLIKFLHQLTKMESGTNSYLVKAKTNLILEENSFLYNTLCYLPTSLCFKDLTTKYHLEVVDKAAWKVDVQVHVTKDTDEIVLVEVNNMQVPTITTICNFMSKKFIAKITPTMMTYELLDGDVSLLKFFHQLTMVETGTNSYLMKGKMNLLLKENSFLQNTLCYMPNFLCFRDLTSNYQLEVVDKAAWKVDVQFLLTKDTNDILNVEISNVPVPKMTTICNFMNKKFIAKITPTMMTYELLDGDVSLIKYLSQLTKMEVGTNSYIMEGKTNLFLKEDSFLYNTLCYVPTSLCFKDLTTNYHLEVVDKAASKVNVQVQVTKDTHEIVLVEVNNVQDPKITTICNFMSKKFIAKIIPTMMSFELLDGEVSLIKYRNQLTKMEVGTNSYLMEGKTNMLLKENSFLYNTLCYVPTSICFKDMTANYHFEVVDKAAWKVDVQVLVTKDTHEIFNVEVNNLQVPKITTICNFMSKKFIAKITPTMITFELLDGEVSLVKYLNQLTKMEVGTNSYLMEGKTNILLKENSFLYNTLCFVPTSICFKDMTANFHLEVVDKAAWKVDVQVLVTKDTHEILNVEVNNVHVPKITAVCNFISKKLIAKIMPTMITFELLDGEVSLVKYLNQLTKMEVGTNSYLMQGKANLLLKENSFLYNTLCFVPTSICFKDMTTNYHIEVVDKAVGKVNVKVHVTKDTLEILNVEVKPTVGNQNEVEVNGFPLVQVALINKQIKISTINKDVPAITAIITLKTFSLFENSVGIQLFYEQMAHKTLLGWNIYQLKKAFVDIKATGSGIPILGGYKLLHHLNWSIMDIKNMVLEWNGKVISTGLSCLNTPLVTDGKLKIDNYIIGMKMVETYNNEPYTMILRSKPLKIALLPFFAYP